MPKTLVAGSIVMLGPSGRMVYVQNVTPYAAYVISLPEQHDYDRDQDRRFLGPTSAIVTSPFCDAYAVDSQMLSNKNLDFIEKLTDFDEHQFKLRAGRKPITVRGQRIDQGDVVNLTNADAMVLGDKLVKVGEEPPPPPPPPPAPTGPPPLRIELLNSTGLGKLYTRLYFALQTSGPKPTLTSVIPVMITEAKKGGVVLTELQCDWHLHNLAKLGHIRIVE